MPPPTKENGTNVPAEIKVLQALNSANISYCHWKSNNRLSAALAGEEDIDLLVARSSRDEFESILHACGYKSTRQTGPQGISHFFGLDDTRSSLMHIHVYYSIVTGGSLLKNYRFPIETSILSNCSHDHRIPIPAQEIDLALFAIRKLVEHTSLLEFLFLRREKQLVIEEARWLGANDTPERAARIASRVFPSVPEARFLRWCKLLIKHGVSLRCVAAGFGVARRLREYRIATGFKPVAIRCFRFFGRIISRCLKRSVRRDLSHGGTVVAVVGADATGKSTVSAALRDLLSSELRVRSFHAGLPPASLLTYIPRMFLPLARRIVPSIRTTRVQDKVIECAGSVSGLPPRGFALWVFAFRSLMIAYDRSRLLQRMARLAASGAVVIVDRYPTDIVGAMDSAQLDVAVLRLSSGTLLYRLAKLENRLYLKMPPADVILRLEVSLETAIDRNQRRVKAGKEGERYLARRHMQAGQTIYKRGEVININTEGALSDTMRKAITETWQRL